MHTNGKGGGRVNSFLEETVIFVLFFFLVPLPYLKFNSESKEKGFCFGFVERCTLLGVWIFFCFWEGRFRQGEAWSSPSVFTWIFQ